MQTTSHRCVSAWVGVTICAWLCVAQVIVPEIPPQIVLSHVLESSENETACQSACKVISARYPDHVFVGRTGNFEFWDAKQAELIPACRIEPASAEEISWSLRQIVETDCHFAVKSGGHDRTPGSSNAHGGITIDLARLNQIAVASNRESVTIGAGLRWLDVYSALEKEQLMVLGGRIADVGVGGLLLGGGISFFSNERGWACDSIAAYELVLPNSSVVDVTKSSFPDLYRALRGAGASNFGIVSSFTLETFAAPPPDGVWTAQQIYSWEETPALLRANHKTVAEAMDADPGIAIMEIFSCHPNYGLCYGVVNIQHSKHRSVDSWPDSLEFYGQIKGLQPTALMQISPISNITAGLAGSDVTGKYRVIYGTFTYAPSVELESEILTIFREEVNSIRNLKGFLPGVIMHPLSKTMISMMSKNGGNALYSVATHVGPLIIMNVSWQWDEKIDDALAYAAYHRLMTRAEEAAKQSGLWYPYKYINYAEASQDVFEGYGEEMVAKLRQLQRSVDPMQVFTRGGLASGFFKLNDYVPLPDGQERASQVWDKTEL